MALIVTAPGWAGRPLATDDAGTADRATCQVEVWHETAGQPDHALVLAPACGVAEDLELGADYTMPHPQDPVRAAAGLALKWVPATWRVEAGAGALNFGLKLAGAYEQPVGSDWLGSQTTLLLLSSYSPATAWALHVNLGLAQEQISGATARLLNLAGTWEPHSSWLLFVEGQTNDRRETFGQAVQTTGLRYWLLKDKLGVDLTASHRNGSDTVWTVGFGWYGMGGR